MSDPIPVLRHKLQQLQSLHEAGSLGAEAYAAARGPLERALVDRVLQDEPAPPLPTVSPLAKPPRKLQATLLLAVLVLAVAGYMVTGSPEHAGVSRSAPAAATASAEPDGPPVSDDQVNEIVARIAQRLKEQPEDGAGWALLARAYSAMGRHTEAVPAFQKALALNGADATLMADYADTLAAQNNGRFDAEALKLIERALVLEPDNFKALALSGSAAFDNRDYALAVRQWEQVERNLPADSRMLPQVRSSIAQARELGGLPAAAAAAPVTPIAPAIAAAAAKAPAAAPGAQAKAPAAAPAAAAKALRGSVSLAPAVAAKVGPEATVYILARPAEGPRMPLAVLRKQVKDLPLTFMLDDSMAMAPTAKISDHARIVVLARISKSGDALPQPGDLFGQSTEVAPGASGITILISDVVGSK